MEHSHEESEWRRYDIIQYVWIKLIIELRAFGVPLDIIKEAKKNILSKIDLKWIIDFGTLNLDKSSPLSEDSAQKELLAFIKSPEYENLDETLAISILELMIVEIIKNKVTASIIIFSDGYLLPVFENKIDSLSEQDKVKLSNDTHVKVSLSNILKTFLSEIKDSFLVPQLNILADNEKKLMQIIQSGEYEMITINFKNKKMKSVDLIKEQNIKRRLVDILQDSKYQDIVIKSHKGVVTRI